MLMPSILRERFFDDLFDFENFEKKNLLPGKTMKNLIKSDIKETDGKYQICMDVPGYSKEDIRVSLSDGYLNVQAKKDVNKVEKDREERIIRQERYSGSVSRSFFVGEDMKEEEAEVLRERIEELYPDCDVELNYGGQPIYYYIISVE